MSVIFGKDVSYYCKDVLHYKMTEEGLKKIKDLNLEPYIPIQNLYAAGPKGNETGRPYYIPNGEYCFDFNKYMVTPGEFQITGVTQPKYGSLQKNSNGTYTYIPKKDLPANTIDEFLLKVRIKAGDIEQERELVCKIGTQYHQSKIEKYQIEEQNLQKAIEQTQNITPYAISYSENVDYTTDQGMNVSKGTGFFIAEESGEYEFQAYGDDQIQFELMDQNKKYISNTSTYTSGANNAYANKNSTHFTIKLEKGKTYSYVLYTNNTGGNGKGAVAYRKLGEEAWQSISNHQLYLNKEDVGKETDRSWKQPTMPYYRREVTTLGNSILQDYSKATVLETPNRQNSDGNDASAIIDGNRNTFFHSAYTGKITPYPHNYVIDFGEVKEFDTVSIYTRASNTNGTIGDYKIYIASENPEKESSWREIASDLNRKGNASAPITISNFVGKQKARYIKVQALNNKNGSNFTIVSSIELAQTTKVAQVIAQNSSYLSYIGDWKRNTEGNFLNSATYDSKNGIFQYGFEGTQTAIYSRSGATVKVKIDKQDWREEEILAGKNTPSLILEQGQAGKHMVEIQVISGEIQLDAVTTDGKFIYYEKTEEPTPPPIEEELKVSFPSYQEKENFVIGIKEKTNGKEFKQKIQTNAEKVILQDPKGMQITDGIVSTGSKVILTKGMKQKEYTLIVTGDINQDGQMDITDLLLLKRHILSGTKPEWKLSKVKELAANMNQDNQVDITDLLLIKRNIIKK